MHALAAMASAAGAVDLDTFPAWLRITHFINFVMMGFLALRILGCGGGVGMGSGPAR